VRRLLWVSAISLFASASTAWAAPPAVTASATPPRGAAPLAVTLQAAGDAASYRWDLGDGSAADGASVAHTYAAGSWTATVTATAADGETSTATVSVVAVGIALAAPAAGRYGKPAVVGGTIVPAAAGTPVALYTGSAEVSVASTRADGGFRLRVAKLRSPGPYVVRTADASSQPLTIPLRPLLTASFAGAGVVRAPLTLHAAAQPAAAGTLRIRIWRNGRLVRDLTRRGTARVPIDTTREAAIRAAVSVAPNDGWLAERHTLARQIVVSTLALGATGPSVRALDDRLAAMHYALRDIDSRFGDDDYDAVLAFQKVHGLARTGRVDAALWRRIFTSSTPRARYGGTHVEVDKTRQVLFEVRNGKVVLVVHVSTGATGNTPVGVWQIYRRVPGWDWVLYYPSYFLRGFAIHGYPDVPAYPASHGCVRVPLWIATRLYAMQSYGEAVYVYP
jgi:PKD repeat protein